MCYLNVDNRLRIVAIDMWMAVILALTFNS